MLKYIFFSLILAVNINAEELPDYTLMLTNCKMLAADVFESPKSQKALKIVKGDGYNIMCMASDTFFECASYDLKNKPIGSKSAYEIIKKTKNSIQLGTRKRESRLYLNLLNGVASSIENLAFDSMPNLSGSKVCAGTVINKQQLKRALANEK